MTDKRDKLVKDLRRKSDEYDKAVLAVLKEPSEAARIFLREIRDKAEIEFRKAQLKLSVYDLKRRSAITSVIDDLCN